jgi:DNA-binding transcriptional LysR family regulator
VELRELRAFVAVVEEGGFSPAARRLHLSQPALSQIVGTLERQLGVRLLVRSSTGAQPTDEGRALLIEARELITRHDQAVAAVTRFSGKSSTALRVGIPLELPSNLLTRPVDVVATKFAGTMVRALHLPTSAQFAALRADELDVGLVREHPLGQDLAAIPVVMEPLGVLLGSDAAAHLAGPDGVRLDALTGLAWVGFPRSGSPAWYDEVTAILRSHGLDLGPKVPDVQELIPEVKFAAVASGTCFALAPPNWSQPMPDNVAWCPLIDHPITRRTWAVWPAASRRSDVAAFVGALEDAALLPD